MSLLGQPVTEDLIDALLSCASSYTTLEAAVQDIALCPIDAEDIATMRELPTELRVHVLVRLHELVDQLREHVRELDGLLLDVPANG